LERVTLAVMTDSQLQAKLDQLTKLTNEIDREIVRRYGREARLFYESDGFFHVMTDDTGGLDRQQFVKMSSNKVSRLQCGSW